MRGKSFISLSACGDPGKKYFFPKSVLYVTQKKLHWHICCSHKSLGFQPWVWGGETIWGVGNDDICKVISSYKYCNSEFPNLLGWWPEAGREVGKGIVLGCV